MKFQLVVKGIANSKASQQIVIDAANEAEAIRIAAKGGWHVSAIEYHALTNTQKFESSKQFPLLQFTQELLALLEAGLNLTEAVSTLYAKEARSGIKRTLVGILTSLQQGQSFSQTLAAFPIIFPDIYIASIRAAERSGNLPEALSRFVAYQLQFDAIKKKLISASIYPAMLLMVGGFVTLFLLGYVVPKFSAVYDSSGRDIPWASQILLSIGQLIHQHSIVFFGIFACVFLMMVYAIATPSRRRVVFEKIVSVPFLSRKVEEFRLSRFYRALSLLLHAGIPLSKALAMVAGLLTEKQQGWLKQARIAVEEGQSFSTALETFRLSTPVAQSLLKVGENTGRLGDMLERSAKFHDEDFARWVDWASRLLEPILMTIIGAVIGTVVVMLYMPIFELAGSLS